MKFINEIIDKKEWGRFLFTGITFSVIFWLIGYLGGFTLLDGFSYDLIFKTSLKTIDLPAKVVLVEIPPFNKNLTDEECLQVITTINKYHPALIAFNFIPQYISQATLENIKKTYNEEVIFGYTNGSIENQSKKISLLKKFNIPIGFVGLPPISTGISRSQNAYYSINEKLHTGFEIMAAKYFLGAEYNSTQSNKYLVFFRGKTGSLPKLDIERVLRDDLVKSIIQDKCIIIGFGRNHSIPGISTPTTSKNNPMSFLEFQGHAINTLITEKPIVKISPLLKLTLILFFSFLSISLYYRLYMRIATWFTLLLMFCYILIGFICFISLRIWFPVGELLLLQLILFIIVIRNKNITADRSFQNLLLDLNSKLRERYYPTSIYRVKEHWAQVIAMVIQTLSIQRLIFLERIPGDHRVREVESFNCTFSDIDERRRDYHRFPYNEAIKNNSPFLVPPKRAFFRIQHSDEQQYLVPLNFAGDILGFWAFGVSEKDSKSIPDFIQVIRNYAYTIGELLYNRQVIQRREARDGNIFRYIAITREVEAYSALKQTIAFLKRRFDNLAALFNGLTTYTIVYDLFGRVLEVNQNMLDLLKNENLAPYKSTAADLITKLTGNTLLETQQLLRKTVNDRISFSFLVPMQHKYFTLMIRPLEFTPAKEDFQEPMPFGINGIVCELVETTSMVEIYEIMQQLTGELSSSITNQMDYLLNILYLMKQSQDEEKRNKYIRICQEKIYSMMASINRCHAFIASSANLKDFSQLLPVNSIKFLKMTINILRSVVEKKRIKIIQTSENKLNSVYAMPDFLQYTFEYILTVLINDTHTKGEISIKSQEEDEFITFIFSNMENGFGMPQEKIDEQLFGKNEELNISKEIKNLRESIEWIKAWGGMLMVNSEIGKGTEVTLSLGKTS